MAVNGTQSFAHLLAKCLENEGVKFVFGLPGEENIDIIEALNGSSSIRFILVRHEQAASFMADMYGRVSGKAGVCLATLGPGAINLLLGTADAFTDSAPLVALSAQVGLDRAYKETHQLVDLLSMFKPITKWAAIIETPSALPEMIRKAFKVAQAPRPGSCYISIPEDIERSKVSENLKPLLPSRVYDSAPLESQVERATKILEDAKFPIIVAGHGAARNNAQDALVRLSEKLNIPVATTFMGKGIFPSNHPNFIGTVGFADRDYVNFGFDRSDVIISVGYDLQEFDPVRINRNADKKIIHIAQLPAEVDDHYTVAVGIESSLSVALDQLSNRASPKKELKMDRFGFRMMVQEELESGAKDNSFPLKPQRIVYDTRAALGESDIVLVDTGALKMWMARLYPTFKPNTCLVSNGLSTMAFALPGAIAVKLAFPERKVLASCGDGGFMMNSSELETAMRENIPIVVLIWVDGSYGLIKWEMDNAFGHHSSVDFTNPDFVRYAESFGAKGYQIEKASELLPILKTAFDDDTVSVIACPVDYSENVKLKERI
ncbi:MAG: acetolactate synthase large subunit [archaeon]|nr:acetolactate synthase large subunit [archaeon]